MRGSGSRKGRTDMRGDGGTNSSGRRESTSHARAAAATEEVFAPGGETDWIEPLDKMRRVENEDSSGGWVEPSAKNFKVRRCAPHPARGTPSVKI